MEFDGIFKYMLAIQGAIVLFSMGAVVVVLWLIGKWLGVW